ncbi:hypothetical protein LTR56_017250 [Elasticomyces elasticus]|nr:hypothetical protein LTR56_017250 [Elasticomyces elasticus]KAK3644853.1 hypothetical protein LTR22_014999 [Elasticomyces elasticus]KAK4923322.1 hypothetical protein LTR49_009392 [Elasticomyces elasticus]KAK5751132.1 hypothetical protein LTS12_018766 [Elasticomyces elasticus]
MAPKISTSSRVIRAEAIDPTVFAPFGEVIQNPATHGGVPNLQKIDANQGSATKWMNVTSMRNWYGSAQSRKPAEIATNMFVCKPRQLDSRNGKDVFVVKILERHPYTPQTFVPLGVERSANTCYLVVVAPTMPTPSRRSSNEGLEPAYPLPEPRQKRTLRERLLGSRPNPFTNDFAPSTTPNPSALSGPKPKGVGLPDLEKLHAFIVRGDQGITYGAGTWHAPMVVLGEKAIDFVVVQYMNGVALDDCQEVEVETEGDGLAVDVGNLFEQGMARARL